MERSKKAVPNPKERLLKAAQELFGDRDPSDVSVRELAKTAQVNIASINYHYQTKENLYQAVVECIIQMMEKIFRGVQQEYISEKEDFFKNEMPSLEERKEFYIGWYKRFVKTIAWTILSRHMEGNSMHKLMIREQMNAGSGFHKLYEKLHFFFLLMDECLEQITGERGRKNILRVHALMGQIIIFVATSATVTKRLKIEKMNENDLEEVVDVILENTDAVLHHLGEWKEVS